ncbi:glycosyltransferase family 39 protein [Flavicella sp.]|uniref:glycosyltransferase family 39 protein n=1 Tax=Flavicella sp. TaxID=2957742 RepID=UPI002623D2E7|nr:glycosyltransferase family 39 protein [Flavicella sp.]MDG1806062.1 glycosyltransferase family 39 protein [Flavicella sp.]
MNRVTEFLKSYPALSILLGFQLFRFFLLPFMGLMPQDAYYHFYGENLSLSYFDHPGMIGYILRFFTTIFGKSVFVVKFADFFITSITLFSFYKLGSIFLSKAKLNNALVLLSTTVFISILSINSTPDVPLILFWTLSLICLSKAIFENKKIYWILGGIAMGLAFNSKYTALLLQIGLLAFLVFSAKYRKLLVSPWVWASLLISVMVTFPVWYWNYQNEFASFLFQSSDRTGSISKFQVNPKYFFGAVGHQIFLLLPILLIAFFTLLYKYIKKAVTKFKLPSDKVLFLLAFFLPTFLGFFLLTPIYWVKLNWMMPSYISGVLLAAIFIKKKNIKLQVYISAGIHVLVSLQVLFYLVPIKSDDTWVGWKELVIETEALQQQYPNSFVFSDDGYKTTACMTFFTEQKIYAQNIIGKPALHFDYIGDDLSILKGQTALFIDSDKRFKDKNKNGSHPAELDVYFSKVKELDPIIIQINGKDSRKFWVYACSNYTPKK